MSYGYSNGSALERYLLFIRRVSRPLGFCLLAASGAGIGIGNVFGSLITAGARNPSHMKQLFGLNR